MLPSGMSWAGGDSVRMKQKLTLGITVSTTGMVGVVLLTLLLIALTLSACNNPRGHTFQPINLSTNHCTVVYLYFPRFRGSSWSGKVLANSVPMDRISEGGYIPFIVPDSPFTLSIEDWGQPVATLALESLGNVPLFVKLIGTEWSVRKSYYKLVVVPSEQGMKEIRETRLMESDGSVQIKNLCQ